MRRMNKGTVQKTQFWCHETKVNGCHLHFYTAHCLVGIKSSVGRLPLLSLTDSVRRWVRMENGEASVAGGGRTSPPSREDRHRHGDLRTSYCRAFLEWAG